MINILYLYEDLNTNMTNWQKLNFIDELKSQGHTINLINVFNYLNTEKLNESLTDLIEKNKIDVFFTSISNVTISNYFFDLCKRKGIPTVLICFDNLHAPFIHKNTCSLFDLVWLTSKENINLFKKWGAKKIIFQPYASNPNIYKPRVKGEFLDQISFIGTPYGSRKNIINYLGSNNIPIHLYSNKTVSTLNIKNDFKNFTTNTFSYLKTPVGRKIIVSALMNKYLYLENSLNENITTHSSLSFKEMINIYSNSKLNLNVIELRNTFVLKNPIYKLHLRTFEIPMSGGVQLVAYTKELSEYFEEDKEILFYRSKEELIEKTSYYLSHKNEKLIRLIQQNARKRALQDHTWTIRFNNLFNAL